jgi:hypothetical protein
MAIPESSLGLYLPWTLYCTILSSSSSHEDTDDSEEGLDPVELRGLEFDGLVVVGLGGDMRPDDPDVSMLIWSSPTDRGDPPPALGQLQVFQSAVTSLRMVLADV